MPAGRSSAAKSFEDALIIMVTKTPVDAMATLSFATAFIYARPVARAQISQQVWYQLRIKRKKRNWERV